MRRAERWEIERLIAMEKRPGITHVAIGRDERECEFFAIGISDIEAFLKNHERCRDPRKDEQPIDEIFNLSLPIQDQLMEYRAWHIEPPASRIIAKAKNRVDIRLLKKERVR